MCILQGFESCMKNPLYQGPLDYKRNKKHTNMGYY